MQPTKPSYQAVNNPGSSSQHNPDISELLRLLEEYNCSYSGMLASLDDTSPGAEFNTFDDPQLSSEIPLSAQTEDDFRHYEFPARDRLNANTATPEHSTPDDTQYAPSTPVINDPSEAIGLVGVWGTDFPSYIEPFNDPIPSAGPLSDSNESLYPVSLNVQPPSVTDEEHHGNDICHEDQLSPNPNSVVDNGMTDWRRQAQEPSFRVNVCSSSNSPSEESTRRRRRSSSEQESRYPKRQRLSHEASPSLLGVGCLSQNCGGAIDSGSNNRLNVRNHSQIRTAPEAIAVGDLFQVAAQDQELPTRKKRAHSLGQEGYQCPKCEQRFKRVRDIPRHVKGVHEEIRYICEHCGKSYTRDDSRKRHYTTCPNKPKNT